MLVMVPAFPFIILAVLPSPSSKLLLHNLLRVPLCTQNLISVRQFCANNSVFFEFYYTYFCVKDLRTGSLLLHNPIRNRLYVFPSPLDVSTPPLLLTPQANVGKHVSASHWHLHLGHPSLKLVHQILHRFKLPVSATSASSGLCSACFQAKSHSLPFSRSTSSVS